MLHALPMLWSLPERAGARARDQERVPRARESENESEGHLYGLTPSDLLCSGGDAAPRISYVTSVMRMSLVTVQVARATWVGLGCSSNPGDLKIERRSDAWPRASYVGFLLSRASYSTVLELSYAGLQ